MQENAISQISVDLGVYTEEIQAVQRATGLNRTATIRLLVRLALERLAVVEPVDYDASAVVVAALSDKPLNVPPGLAIWSRGGTPPARTKPRRKF